MILRSADSKIASDLPVHIFWYTRAETEMLGPRNKTAQIDEVKSNCFTK